METEENLIYLFNSVLKWYLESFSHFQIIVDIFEKMLNDFPYKQKMRLVSKTDSVTSNNTYLIWNCPGIGSWTGTLRYLYLFCADWLGTKERREHLFVITWMSKNVEPRSMFKLH